MSSTTASTTHRHHDDGTIAGRTIAQWFCLVGGLALIAAGLLGFIADATFDVDNGVQGDSFLGFEVNGWHNVIHILTGAFLLSGAPKRKSAKTVALAFGLAYLVVTLIGVIDGNDVLTIFPVNAADNVLHALLALAAIAAALASRADDHVGHRNVSSTTGAAGRGEVVDRHTVPTAGRFTERDSRQVAPEEHNETTRRR